MIKDYSQFLIDDNLNAADSLLNVVESGEKLNFLDSLEAPLSEMIESGVIGGISKTLGVEVGENKSANLSYLQSRNYVAGSTGWRFDSAGAIEARSATIAGALTSTSGTIGGWTLGATTLTGGDLILDSAGIIRAGTFMTGADTGNRIEITKVSDATYPNQIRFYTAADVLVGSIINDFAATTGSFNINAENSDNIELAAGGYTRLIVQNGGGIATDDITLPPESVPAAIEGKLYYDATANKLKFYNGVAWETITSA